MRVALISDIHGNDVALQAVLEDIEKAAVDRICCLGDVATLGPAPSAVLEKLRRMACPTVVGNHDAFLLEPELIHSYSEEPLVAEAVEWCRHELSAADLELLRSFRPTLEVGLDDHTSMLLCHGAPSSHMVDILPATSSEEIDQLLSGITANVLAGGHTHVQMVRPHRRMLLVNPGSVGLPFLEYVGGGPPTVLSHAEYAIVESGPRGLSVTLRRIPLAQEKLRGAVASREDFPLRDYLMSEYA